MKPHQPNLGLRLILRTDQVEASLWRRLRYENVADCRLALFERHQSLAQAVAFGELRRRPAYGLERSDLLHLAYGGLLEAIDRYDPRRSVPFEAYARPRIRGAISDGLAQATESSAQFFARMRMERERVRSLRDNAELAEDPLKALSDLAVGLALGFVMQSSERQNGEPLEAPTALEPYDTLAWRELEIGLFEAIALLPQTERTIVEQHYLHETPFNQIAALLGLSKGRISQLHAAALQKIRSSLKQTR